MSNSSTCKLATTTGKTSSKGLQQGLFLDLSLGSKLKSFRFSYNTNEKAIKIKCCTHIFSRRVFKLTEQVW